MNSVTKTAITITPKMMNWTLPESMMPAPSTFSILSAGDEPRPSISD